MCLYLIFQCKFPFISFYIVRLSAQLTVRRPARVVFLLLYGHQLDYSPTLVDSLFVLSHTVRVASLTRAAAQYAAQ